MDIFTLWSINFLSLEGYLVNIVGIPQACQEIIRHLKYLFSKAIYDGRGVHKAPFLTLIQIFEEVANLKIFFS